MAETIKEQQIQLRSPDAIRFGWKASWVKSWSETIDLIGM